MDAPTENQQVLMVAPQQTIVFLIQSTTTSRGTMLTMLQPNAHLMIVL
jgi:hypothetical protein